MVSPQNPYRSVIVNASAGSGKTYQLSHRFLCLVACGASPDTILTITFTNKAAKEMRQRILKLASSLMHDRDQAAAFDQMVAQFHDEALAARRQDGHDDEAGSPPFRRPRTAAATAREVLAWSQRLRVITIDAVFLSWQGRFAYEARQGKMPHHRLTVADEWQSLELSKKGFQRGFRRFWDERQPAAKEDGLSPKELRSRIERLQPIETFLWLGEQMSGEGTAFGTLPADRYQEAAACEDYSAWFSRHKDEVAALFAAIGGKKVTERLAAIASGDLERLKTAPTRLLKGDGLISGTVVRGAEHKYLMAEINAKLALFEDAQKAKALAAEQDALAALYRQFAACFDQAKADAGVVEFADAAKGCFRLFHQREYDSVRFYLQQHISHIMIDEFQDTNLLQWQIFRELAVEILAGYDPGFRGEYLLSPSVFLVGDPKQSIYRFREAEASLLSHVASQLTSLAEVQLAHSYRSSPTVLRFVNLFFAAKIKDFPEHQPALGPAGKPLIADVSEVLIVEPFLATSADAGKDARAQEAKGIDARAQEARWLAEDIAARLAQRLPVGPQRRPLRPRDIAILTRTNEAMTTVAAALRELGLPASPSSDQGAGSRGGGGPAGLWARPEAVDALAAVKVLAFPLDELAWLTLLASPLVGIGQQTIWAHLAKAAPKRKPRWSVELVEGLLQELLADEPALQRLLCSMAASAATGSLPPSAALSQLVQQAQRRQAYEALFGQEDAVIAYRNLRRIIHALVAIEQTSGQEPSACYHELIQQSLKGAIKAPGGSGQGVQIMTIHKAKGLEFPLVYVMGCHKSWERSERYWLKSPAEGKVYYIGTAKTRPGSDPTLAELVAKEQDAEVAENLRLLYVGLTRASQYLVMTGHGTKPDGGYHLSHALKVACDQPGFTAVTRHGQQGYALTGAVNARAGAVNARAGTEHADHSPGDSRPTAGDVLEKLPPSPWPQRQELKILAPSRLLSAPDEDTLSSTGAGTEPSPLSSAEPGLELPIPWTAAEGTFIHACLERFFGEGWSEDDVADLYPRYFPAHTANSLPGHKNAILSYWRHILAQQAFLELSQGAIELVPELAMVYIDGDQLISGSIDLLVVRGGGEATIIDFKTTLATAYRGEDAWRQHSLAKGYHRQLAYYRNGLRQLRPELTIRCGLYYTAPGLYLEMPEYVKEDQKP